MPRVVSAGATQLYSEKQKSPGRNSLTCLFGQPHSTVAQGGRTAYGGDGLSSEQICPYTKADAAVYDAGSYDVVLFHSVGQPVSGPVLREERKTDFSFEGEGGREFAAAFNLPHN